MGEWLHAQNIGSDPREKDPIAQWKSTRRKTKSITAKPFTLGTHHQIWDYSAQCSRLRHWRDNDRVYAKDHKMLQTKNLFEEFIAKTSAPKEDEYAQVDFLIDVKKINIKLRKANRKFSVRAKKPPAKGDLFDLGTLLRYDALLIQKKDKNISDEEFDELAAEIESPKRFPRKKTFSQYARDDGDEKPLTRRSKRRKKEVCYADDFSNEF